MNYLSAGYDPTTVSLLLRSWRSGTKAAYHTYLKQWVDYAMSHGYRICKPHTRQAVAFLSSLFSRGCSYHQLNLARSALSALFTLNKSVTWGRKPIVKRQLKGVFEARPFFPKYHSTWDVQNVFNYFRSLPSLPHLSLKQLTHKLCMLLIILSGGQRCQTIHSIVVSDIHIVNSTLVIPIMEKVKQTTARNHLAPLRFQGYPYEPELCVVRHLAAYLRRTQDLRQCAQLFLSYIKPHRPVGKETLSRWCTNVLKDSGIDINTYQSHSSRAATTSMAKKRGASLKTIINAAGWTNERTFAKFYDKVIDTPVSIEQCLL